jgi:DNA polymerase III subunit epsilon
MREIVLDTETTGLDPAQGHRVVEIACVELMHHLPTGREFQTYLDPERDMPDEAFRVHGLSSAFLTGKPRFAEIVDRMFDFLGDARLVIHNAEFDLRFLNAELARVERAPLTSDRAIDTVGLARRRFPGARASLDALCQRFAIDLSGRAEHGALIDAKLLAQVYLELIGGRQPGLELATAPRTGAQATGARSIHPPRPHAPTEEELAAHALLVQGLKDPVWRS